MATFLGSLCRYFRQVYFSGFVVLDLSMKPKYMNLFGATIKMITYAWNRINRANLFIDQLILNLPSKQRGVIPFELQNFLTNLMIN